MNILFFGDVVGKPGRRAVTELLPRMIKKYEADFVIVNAENASGHSGITLKNARALLSQGADVLTMGNHTWVNPEIHSVFEKGYNVIRPHNYIGELPGNGMLTLEKNGVVFTVVNLIGQVFLPFCESPFHSMEKLLKKLPAGFTVVDFHAEATSEKICMGYFLDGKVSAVIGTHTHVQTADEQILPNGTAYITDAGMCGPSQSILGIRSEIVLEMFIKQSPVKFEVAKEIPRVQGVFIRCSDTFKAEHIERFSVNI